MPNAENRIPMSELADEMEAQVRQQEPVIKTTLDKVEQRGGHGLPLCQIDVENEQGQIARTWVRAYYVRNRLHISVAYNQNVRGVHGVESTRSVSKSVAPIFRV